jgi:hypothetical protein
MALARWQRACLYSVRTEVPVKRLIGTVTIGLLLAGGVLHADHGKKSKKHAKTHDSATVAVSFTWSNRDVVVVREHYAPRYRSLPKGLQKKYAKHGHLPPGWQKKMEPLPVVIEREMVVLPAGYRRGVFDGHMVICNSSGTIIDVAVLF